MGVRAARMSCRRLLAFYALFFVFLLPVIVALIRDWGIERADSADAAVHATQPPASKVPHPRHHMMVMITDKDGHRFLLACTAWIMTVVAVYIALRIAGHHVPSRYRIKLHAKSAAKHKDDVLRLLYYALTLCAVGGVAARIDENIINTETQLSFIPLVLVYTVAFTMLFEFVKDQDITLSATLRENSLGISVVVIGVLLLCILLVSLFNSAWKVSSSFFQMYVGLFVVCLVIHFALFLPRIPCTTRGRSFLHVHHWYWPVPLAHMCIFNTDSAMLAQAIFLAVHLHGVGCFGTETLFYETERRARHPSDFDWVLRPHVKAGSELRESDDDESCASPLVNNNASDESDEEGGPAALDEVTVIGGNAAGAPPRKSDLASLAGSEEWSPRSPRKFAAEGPAAAAMDLLQLPSSFSMPGTRTGGEHAD